MGETKAEIPNVQAVEKTMRAAVYREYGTPDVLGIETVERPIPNAGEVLVRVARAAINPGDRFLLSGTPYLLRPSSGVVRPRKHILGLAVAGRVEALGSGVTGLRVGDEVFGEVPAGGFAEYVCVSEEAVARKPAFLTFEQAAAIPVSGVTALQGLRDTGRIQPGQSALINGASGGVGTFAVQLAKHLGAEVTGVCSGPNVELVHSIGADHVIDYTTDDFTVGERYDLILDNVGNRSLRDLRRALTPKGMLIPNANTGGRWVGDYLARAVRALLLSPFVSQTLRPFSAKGSRADLVALSDLMEAGKIVPVIDRTYPLAEIAAALAYFGEGHAHGKVIIAVAN